MTSGRIRTVPAPAVVPTINVTPLVDVVLVLLIVFMIVAPQLADDVPLTLPAIFHADPDSRGEPFTVSIAAAGDFRYDGRRYDLDGLVATLEAAHAAAPSRRLALRADVALPYGAVRELQRRLREVGFPGLSFLVTERHHWAEGN